MKSEDREKLTKVWIYMNLYFIAILLFNTLLTVFISYQIPSLMEYSCPSCDKVYACQEFKEDVRLIYNINKTSLKSMCSSVL